MNRTDRSTPARQLRTPRATAISIPRPHISSHSMAAAAHEDCFAQACDHEEAGRLHEAMRSYRRVIDVAGPTASACFNLANVLYRLRRKVEAVDWYRQALTLDDHASEAWNNLGVVLCELRHCDEAMRSFHRAIVLAPSFADAHYNLADCLDERGQSAAAQRSWKDYLRLDGARHGATTPARA